MDIKLWGLPLGNNDLTAQQAWPPADGKNPRTGQVKTYKTISMSTT